MKRERERGIAMLLAAIFLVAIIAIGAIAIEVSRLTATATEVQVAADAAALAAATSMIVPGHTSGVAQSDGQAVAAKNITDGRSPAPANVQIEFGTYQSATGFVAGTPDNAVRATVTIDNVQYLLAGVIGGLSTSVQKRAVAAYKCGNCASPAPITVCDCALQATAPGEPCTSITGGALLQTPNGNQNSCLLSTAGGGADEAWFPSDCFPTGETGPLIGVGDSITLDNGQLTPVINDFQTCFNVGVTDFVIPIVHCGDSGICSGGVCSNGGAACSSNVDCCFIGNCNHTGTVVGFATMHVTAVNSHGSPKTVSLTQVCNNASSGGPCVTAATTCFGTGSVKLVDDLPHG
jgi:hypothetical protein